MASSTTPTARPQSSSTRNPSQDANTSVRAGSRSSTSTTQCHTRRCRSTGSLPRRSRTTRPVPTRPSGPWPWRTRTRSSTGETRTIPTTMPTRPALCYRGYPAKLGQPAPHFPSRPDESKRPAVKPGFLLGPARAGRMRLPRSDLPDPSRRTRPTTYPYGHWWPRHSPSRSAPAPGTRSRQTTPTMSTTTSATSNRVWFGLSTGWTMPPLPCSERWQRSGRVGTDRPRAYRSARVG
jgi:hypothetical protein